MLEKNRMEEPRRSVVQVAFGERNATYSYYNDQFDLHRGDFVRVEGQFEDWIGCVLEVHYNFKVKRSAFKKVVSKVELDQMDPSISGGELFFVFDRTVFDPVKANALFGVKTSTDEEEFYMGSGDPGFSMDRLDEMHIHLQEARYGFHSYAEGEVEFLCLDGSKGTAIIRSRFGSVAEVTFEYREGKVQNLSCSCFSNFNCEHEFAACKALYEIKRDHKAEYEGSGYFAAVRYYGNNKKTI